MLCALVRTIGVYLQPVRLGRVEVKDARLVMINPDYRMNVFRHWSLAHDPFR